MTEHIIEAITPDSTAEAAGRLLIGCSCGAEITSADDAAAVETAFPGHVPGACIRLGPAEIEHGDQRCRVRRAAGRVLHDNP